MKHQATLLNRRLAIGALLSMGVSACGLARSFKSMGQISDDLYRELGVKSAVNIVWSNGKKRVRVTLEGKPKQKPEVVRETVQAIAMRHVPDLDEVEVIGEI